MRHYALTDHGGTVFDISLTAESIDDLVFLVGLHVSKRQKLFPLPERSKLAEVVDVYYEFEKEDLN